MHNSNKKNIILITLVFILLVASIITACFLIQSKQTVQNSNDIKNDIKSNDGINNITLNCKDYEELDTDNEHDWEYYQNYIQCTFDEKLKKLNQEHKITEQDKYFEDLEFLFEHIYENSKKYGGGIPDPLPGKYDSMNISILLIIDIIYHIT